MRNNCGELPLPIQFEVAVDGEKIRGLRRELRPGCVEIPPGPFACAIAGKAASQLAQQLKEGRYNLTVLDCLQVWHLRKDNSEHVMFRGYVLSMERMQRLLERERLVGKVEGRRQARRLFWLRFLQSIRKPWKR